jgi:hypothetical protein
MGLGGCSAWPLQGATGLETRFVGGGRRLPEFSAPPLAAPIPVKMHHTGVYELTSNY